MEASLNPKGWLEGTALIEKKKLTDGSYVYDVVIYVRGEIIYLHCRDKEHALEINRAMESLVGIS